MHLNLGLVGLSATICIYFGCGQGCSKAAGNGAIVGTWVFDATHSVFPDAAQGALIKRAGPDIVYRFKPGGTFTEEPGEVGGRYRMDGRRVILTISTFQGIALTNSQESGLIFLGPRGKHLSIYSRDPPTEIIALEKAGL